MISVVIPTCTDAHVFDCLTSMEDMQSFSTEHVILVDSGLTTPGNFGSRLAIVPTALPFVFSRAINDGVKATGANDLLILNDDTTMLTKQWHYKLLDLLFRPEVRNSKIGMIGLAIAGGVGNPEQEARHLITPELHLAEKTVCFVAVLIRRACWDAVGAMDERYIDYGWDDDDYCRRVRNAGFSTMLSSEILVQHGRELPFSNSYAKVHGWGNLAQKMYANQERYYEKWGDYGYGRTREQPGG